MLKPGIRQIDFSNFVRLGFDYPPADHSTPHSDEFAEEVYVDPLQTDQLTCAHTGVYGSQKSYKMLCGILQY